MNFMQLFFKEIFDQFKKSIYQYVIVSVYIVLVATNQSMSTKKRKRNQINSHSSSFVAQDRSVVRQ